MTNNAREQAPEAAAEADAAFEEFFAIYPGARNRFEISYIYFADNTPPPNRYPDGQFIAPRPHGHRADTKIRIEINLASQRDDPIAWPNHRVHNATLRANVHHECRHFLEWIDARRHGNRKHIHGLIRIAFGNAASDAILPNLELRSRIANQVSVRATNDISELIAESGVRGHLTPDTAGTIARLIDEHLKRTYGGEGKEALFDEAESLHLVSGHELPAHQYALSIRDPGLNEVFTQYDPVAFVRTESGILRIEKGVAYALVQQAGGRVEELPVSSGGLGPSTVGEPLVEYLSRESTGQAPAWRQISGPVVEIVRLSHFYAGPGDLSDDRHRNLMPIHTGMPPAMAEYEDTRFRMEQDRPLPFTTSWLRSSEGRLARHIGRPGESVSISDLLSHVGSFVLQDYSGTRCLIEPNQIAVVQGAGRRAQAAEQAHNGLDGKLMLTAEAQTIELGDGTVIQLDGIRRIESLPISPFPSQQARDQLGAIPLSDIGTGTELTVRSARNAYDKLSISELTASKSTTFNGDLGR